MFDIHIDPGLLWTDSLRGGGEGWSRDLTLSDPPSIGQLEEAVVCTAGGLQDGEATWALSGALMRRGEITSAAVDGPSYSREMIGRFDGYALKATRKEQGDVTATQVESSCGANERLPSTLAHTNQPATRYLLVGQACFGVLRALESVCTIPRNPCIAEGDHAPPAHGGYFVGMRST
jgi:hypothetical protein